jgi:hypothetical protein
MKVTLGKPKDSGKTGPSTTIPNIKPTPTNKGANPGLRREKSAPNRLSYVAAMSRHDSDRIDYNVRHWASCLSCLELWKDVENASSEETSDFTR